MILRYSELMENRFMRRAIELSLENVRTGKGGPPGEDGGGPKKSRKQQEREDRGRKDDWEDE